MIIFFSFLVVKEFFVASKVLKVLLFERASEWCLTEGAENIFELSIVITKSKTSISRIESR